MIEDPSTDKPSGDEGLVFYRPSPEVSRAIQAALGRAIEAAGPSFGEAANAVQAVVARAEPFALVGAFAMYFGTAQVGTNPEFSRPLGVFQHDIELVQALAFGSRFPSQSPPDPPVAVIEETARAVREFTDAWVLLEARKVAQASEGGDRDLAFVMFGLRVKAMSLRGWGYQEPMIRMLQTLLAPLDVSVEAVVGWRPSVLPGWWAALARTVNDRLNLHRDAVREATNWPVDDDWLRRVREQFGTLAVADEAALIVDAGADEDVRGGFIYHSSDLRAHEIYRFNLADLVDLMPAVVTAQTVRSILNMWSLTPTEMGAAPIGTLLLENPVISRPFVISGTDQWHLFCGWILLHNPFALIEQALAGHTDLFNTYLRRRSEFLEDATAALFAKSLPGAQVETALLYTDPADGKEYETDVLVLLDSHALVAEAKSGRLGPEARRGKGRQFRDRIADLLAGPSEQAHRLASLLMNGSGHTFRRKADGTSVTIDPGAVRHVITLGVTLEPFAWLLPRLSELTDVGLVQRTVETVAFNISLLDLELALGLLRHPSEVLHYLSRRTEIERRDFLRGDEADLLGLYFRTSFNLGPVEFEPDHIVDVTGMSDPIDRWHYGQDAGIEIDRPKVERTAWWERMLTRIEERRFPRWSETGTAMCNVAVADQAQFETSMNQLRADINAKRRPPTDILVLHNGPPQRRDVFVGVIAASPDGEARRTQYQSAAAVVLNQESQIDRVIVIAWPPFPIDAPYLAIGMFER